MSEYNYPGYGPTRQNWLTRRSNTEGGYHGGSDNSAEPNTPVYAQYGGKVFRSGNIHGYGMAVVVQSEAPDGTKFYQLYGHLGPGPLPAPGTPVAADQPIPGAVIGTKEYVQRMGGITSGPHLHREVISGNAPLNADPKKGFGIYSSDITHKADPDAFDINRPVFPYEHDEPKPPPQPAGPSLQRPVPSVSNGPTPPQRSPSINIYPLGPSSPPLSPGTAIPGAEDPTSIGGPNGPTPLVPPVRFRSQVPASPAPVADPTLPPLHFAPETPRNFGPFTLPSPWLSNATGDPSPAQKPGGLLGMMIDAGLMPWNPNELAPAPVASQTGDAGLGGVTPARFAAADNASGTALPSNGVAPPSPSNIDRASVRGPSSPMLDNLRGGPNQPPFDVDPMPTVALPWLPLPSSGPSPFDALLAPGRNRAPGDWVEPLPFRPTPSLTQDAPGGIPGLMRQLGAFDPSNPDQPPAGGLMRLIQEYMRDNPDDGAAK